MFVFMLGLLAVGFVASPGTVSIQAMLVTLAGLCGVIAILAVGVGRQQQTEERLQNALTDRIQTETRLEDVNQDLETAIHRTQALAAQAHSASHFKSLFVASMSHEIRTPLTSILGFAENLLCMDLSEAETQTALRAIRRSGEHLLHIINNVLDLSKIEAGKFEFHPAPCSLRNTVEDVVALLQTMAEDRKIEVKAEFKGPVPNQVKTDPTRLRQILINLAGNAVKFTENGRVRIILDATGPANDRHQQLQFDVVDTGIGMTAQQAARIFKAFEQGGATKAARFGGTGLGLTISRHLAELMGGEITFETKPDVGTTFRFRLDVEVLDQTDDHDATANRQASDRQSRGTSLPGTDSMPYRILLAEDSPDNQQLIAFVLSRAGADVTVVANGREAVDAASASTAAFDLILMDMQMPIMDGYEATRWLRHAGCTIPIIALTAHAMDDDREKCIEAGCTDFAAKPIHWAALVETMQRHVQNQPAAPEPVTCVEAAPTQTS